MFETFEDYLKKMIPGVTEQQLIMVRSKYVMKKLRRKEMLLREGDISGKTFVLKGLLRNYSIAENGSEYIMKFTDAGGWTTDPESYNNQVPTKFNIDAIEPSEVIIFSYKDFEILKQAMPVLIEFSERIMAKNISLTQRRVLMNISATAEEKYIDFINSFPNIFNRVPLHMVASYLGVSRETLTRIRQGLALTVKE